MTINSLPMDEALAFAEQAEHQSDLIHALHRDPRGTSAQIAEAHQRQGLALKLAEIHATLAVADELRTIRGYLEGPALDDDPVSRGRRTNADIDAFLRAGGRVG